MPISGGPRTLKPARARLLHPLGSRRWPPAAS